MLITGHTPVILFATDKREGPFNNIARQLSRLLSMQYQFKIIPFMSVRDSEACDILVALWWQSALRVKGLSRPKKIVTCLYDHLSWCIDEASRNQFRITLKHTNLLAVCNRTLLEEVKAQFPNDLPQHTVVLEDGVDTALFREAPLPERFCCGWTGNSTRHTPGGPEDHKGLNLIREAVTQRCGIDLHVLDSAAGRPWPLHKMPEFYAGISVYICASYTEGTPNPVLEALSCGRPVISTRVGLASGAIRHGENGLLIDRDVEAIASAVRYMQGQGATRLQEMGVAARATGKSHSWEKKAIVWEQALRTCQFAPSAIEVGDSLRKAKPSPPPQDVTIEAGSSPRKTAVPPRVLLLSDVRNWAFHRNMLDLNHYLSDELFSFDHYFIADFVTGAASPPDFEAYDGVFSVYHRWPLNHLLPWDRTVGSLRALWFKPEKPRRPSNEEFALVNSYRGFHVVTQQNYDELRERCPKVVYLTNPVDMTRFPDATPIRDRLIASWNGNAQHKSSQGVYVKGFYDIVRPACKGAGVELVYAEYHTARVASEDMADFYQKGNVALCASLYEGASNSVMEAMACGQAVISTAAGNIVELRDSQLKHFGETGVIIIERDPAAFIEAINFLKNDMKRVEAMGRLNRAEITARWSWTAWADRYASFLQMCWA